MTVVHIMCDSKHSKRMQCMEHVNTNRFRTLLHLKCTNMSFFMYVGVEICTQTSHKIVVLLANKNEHNIMDPSQLAQRSSARFWPATAHKIGL